MTTELLLGPPLRTEYRLCAGGVELHATGNGHLLWAVDTEQGWVLRRGGLTEPFVEVARLPSEPMTFAACPRTGRIFVSFDGGQGTLYGPAHNAPLVDIREEGASSTEVLFDPRFVGKHHLASRSTSGALLVWDTRDGGLVASHAARPWSSAGPMGHWVELVEDEVCVHRLIPGDGDPLLRALRLPQSRSPVVARKVTTSVCAPWIATAVVTEEEGNWVYDVRVGIGDLDRVLTGLDPRPVLPEWLPMTNLDGEDAHTLVVAGVKLCRAWDVRTGECWSAPSMYFLGHGTFWVRHDSPNIHRLGRGTWRVPGLPAGDHLARVRVLDGHLAVATGDGRLDIYALP